MKALIRRARGKVVTVARLLRHGEVGKLLRSAVGPLVWVIPYRIDRLDLLDVPTPTPSDRSYICRLAEPGELERLLEAWPDSEEDRVRHREVYETFGFRRCFLAIDRETDRVAHFQFLVLAQDEPQVRAHLAWPFFRGRLRADTAWQEWVYTFEAYRGRGLAELATAFVRDFCVAQGIRWLYSHRGAANRASVRMAEKCGYRLVAMGYEISFPLLGPKRSLYLLRPSDRAT